MLLSSLRLPLSRRASGIHVLAAILMAAALQPALAQGTHLWTQSRLEEFEKGTPRGVALANNGRLTEAPALIERLTTPSSYVWSVAVDKSGTAYLGTASPATVLRTGEKNDANPFTLFETKDLAVQIVRLGPDGALYTATLPSGKVYKLKPDAAAKQDETSATVVFDASKLDDEKSAETKSAGVKSADDKSVDKADKKSHYIWDLTFDSAGRLYIATGGPGAVYRVDPAKPDARPEAFFKTDEQHIRSLAWDAKGNLIAGTDGSGLVYRISPQGKGYVLFEAPRREITSIAIAANGTIYAASVGDKSRNPLPPLPVQGVGMVGITIVQPGSLQAANASSSLPEGTEIYALSEGQAPRRLWTGKDEIVYALDVRPDGLLAFTGNRGRIFRIADDGSYADIGHLEAQQGLSFAELHGSEGMSGILIGTGSTGKLVCLCAAEMHEYASDVLDAGTLARFGRVEVQPGSANYELFARTGNVEQPARGRNGAVRSDWGWSDWQPLGANGTVASPTGRFLQWKGVLHTNGVLGGVGINYLPINAAPEVEDIVVATGARLNPQGQQMNQQNISIAFPSPNPNMGMGAMNFDASSSPLQALRDRSSITVRWAVHDDNGDDLTYSLYLRGDGETVWRLLKEGITEKAYSFDATLIPDGGYQVKVVASDAPSHTPGDALTGSRESDRFEVDTTPPAASGLTAVRSQEPCSPAPCSGTLRVKLDAEDGFSPIARAEYSLDAGPWQYIEPDGRISDSRHEHYDVAIPIPSGNKTAEHLITVRVYDRHDNLGVAKTVVPAPQK